MAQMLRVASKQDIQPGQRITIEHGPEPIVVFNIEGIFYAISDVCPHMGGPLSEGSLEGRELTCPWHGMTFELCAPAAAPNDGACRFNVVCEGDDLLLELP